MFEYGSTSKARLATCHNDIRRVAERALELSPVDITIVWGWRAEEAQNKMVADGASKTPWPNSKHNNKHNGQPLSLAVDFAPWVKGAIPWNDTHLFAVIAGCFLAAAKELGIKIRWGGDWDMDGTTTDQTFMDWGHVELV